MLLKDLIAGLDARLDEHSPQGAPDLRVCDLTEDSRTAVPGSLFVARRGERHDGSAYAAAALDAGAVGVLSDDPAFELPPTARRHAALVRCPRVEATAARLAERFYGQPSAKLTLIGVTGTNGKTTISYLIHQMLNALGVRAGLIGTVVVDDGREVAPAAFTTPPSIELSRTLATMVEAGCRAAVLEVSSHALDQGRVAALAFDVGVFTNLTHDHLDYHKTMDAYGAAKARLFEMLRPPAGSFAGGAAVVNVDDPAHARMTGACRGHVVTCSLTPGRAGATGVAEEPGPRSTRMRLFGPWGQVVARPALVGPHNVMNALEAVAAIHEAFGRNPTRPDGFTATDLEHSLETAEPPPGRLQLVSTPKDKVTVYVDYAHSDDALRTVLNVLARLKAGAGTEAALTVVFGCGGDRDRAKRPKMGALATSLADHVAVTSDNPRTESPAAIIDEILAGVPASLRHKVRVDADRERAIHNAIDSARDGDLVLIAGKGHEDYQLLPDGRGGVLRRDFDDRLVARAALLARREAPARAPVG
jgi:UDP-N-acetylmuramoyl-L-alanyl-D-glutamate--2,6-diaminopimelate ligase